MKIIRVIKVLIATITLIAFALVTLFAMLYVVICMLSLFPFELRSVAFEVVDIYSCILAITEIVLALNYASKMNYDCWIHLWIFGNEVN